MAPGFDPDVRGSVVRVLERSDLRPTGMPPSAILIIRSFRTPSPGRLIASLRGVSPDLTWEKAAQDSLSDLYRHAACPAREAVPANAAAVLFAGQAEMLACLALDWTAGALSNRWWWRAIYGGVPDDRFVVREWIKHSGSIPAALEYLSRRRAIRMFATTLDRDDVDQLLSAIVVEFSLHDLRLVLDSVTHLHSQTEVFPDASQPVADDHRIGNVQLDPTALLSGPGIPWTKWIAEIDVDGLEIGRQAFVGVGLMLCRAPAIVRSRAFAREVGGRFRSEQTSKSLLSIRVLSKSGVSHGKAMSAPDKESSENRTLQLRSGMQPRLAARLLSREAEQAADFGALPAESELTEVPPRSSCDRHSAAIAHVEPESLPSFVQVSSGVSAPVVSEEHIETELGGLFYLVNVAISLELYHDFTMPLSPGLRMPVWDFIELVGRRMLRAQFKRDPVWTFLAHLAGRADRESPGKYFDPPDEWRIPSDWLKPFSSRSIWTWSVNGGRLLVRHREGFYVLDIPGRRDPEKLLHRELTVYNGTMNFVLRRGYLRPTAMLPIERWLDWMVSFILARLRSAFGLSRNRDAVGRLLNHRAEVVAGDERIDINFILADLPIAIRLSGLDRDPGWVPAGGKIIAFHYV